MLFDLVCCSFFVVLGLPLTDWDLAMVPACGSIPSLAVHVRHIRTGLPYAA